MVGRGLSRAPFGVAMSCTSDYAPFLVASIASFRRHNACVPIVVFVDEDIPGLDRLAGKLGFHIRGGGPVGGRPAGGALTTAVRARRLKITAVARVPFELAMYLDSDTLVQDDVE